MSRFDTYIAQKADALSPQGVAPQDAAMSAGVQSAPSRFDQYEASKSQQNASAKAVQASPVANQMSSQGFETLPGVQDEKSYADAIGNAASKGMSLGGLGWDTAPLIAAIPATETDKELGRDYFDRVLTTKKQMDESFAKTAALHPGLTAVTQGITSIPKTIAISGTLSDLGVVTARGQGAVTAGLEALTQSKKESVKGTATEVAQAAAFGYGLGALFDGYSSFKGGVGQSAVDEFGNPLGRPPTIDPLNADRVGVKVKPRPNGDFDIKFGGGYKDSYKLGKEQGKVFFDPEAQAQVEDEVARVFGTEARPGTIPQLIGKTKKDLGTARDEIFKKRGGVPTDVEAGLNRAEMRIEAFDPGGDSVRVGYKSDMQKKIRDLKIDLATKSNTPGDLGQVPLRDAFTAKQNLGERIFGKQNLYRGADDARQIFKDLYGDLGSAASTVDGEVKVLTDAFAGLYKMEENSFNLSKVKSLIDPQAGTAREAYQDFIKPFKDMDPDIRAALMPDIQEYIATELPQTINKVAVMKAITPGTGISPWAIKLSYLTKGTGLKAARSLGALAKKGQGLGAGEAADMIKSSLGTINQGIQNQAPKIGAGLGTLTGNAVVK
jgi:hypothetical protein